MKSTLAEIVQILAALDESPIQPHGLARSRTLQELARSPDKKA